MSVDLRRISAGMGEVTVIISQDWRSFAWRVSFALSRRTTADHIFAHSVWRCRRCRGVLPIHYTALFFWRIVRGGRWLVIGGQALARQQFKQDLLACHRLS